MALNFKDMYKKSLDKLLQNSNVKQFDGEFAEVEDELKKDAGSETLKQIIENDGKINYLAGVDSNRKINFKDEVVRSNQFRELFPRTVTKIVMELAEPNRVLVPLFEEVELDNINVVLPAVSGYGGQLDIPEGEEPQSFTVSTGGFKSHSMGKAGIKVALTDEAYEYLSGSILNYILRQAGIALARSKEKKAFGIIDDVANDYMTGGSGVGSDGSENDTLTFDDILSASMEIMKNGGVPDTLIINPLAFPVFMQNPTLRSLFQISGGSSGSMYGHENVSVSRTTQEELNWFGQKNKTSVNAVNFPGRIFGRGLNVVLSDWVTYSTGSPDTTTAILADSNQIGFHVVKQRPTTTRWEDPAKDIRNFKIIERYALAPKSVLDRSETSDFIQKIDSIAVKKGYDPAFVGFTSTT